MMWSILSAWTIGIIGGFLLGLLVERVRWNELIRKGILPRPQKKFNA